MKIEVYFSDLSQRIQSALLKAAGITKPEDNNWDIHPVTTIVIESQLKCTACGSDDLEETETDYGELYICRRCGNTFTPGL